MVCVQTPGAAAPDADADPDSGPDTGPESVPDGDTQVMYRYAVNAEADPGLVSRALEPFARLNIVPQAVHAVLEPPSIDGQPARQTTVAFQPLFLFALFFTQLGQLSLGRLQALLKGAVLRLVHLQRAVELLDLRLQVSLGGLQLGDAVFKLGDSLFERVDARLELGLGELLLVVGDGADVRQGVLDQLLDRPWVAEADFLVLASSTFRSSRSWTTASYFFLPTQPVAVAPANRTMSSKTDRFWQRVFMVLSLGPSSESSFIQRALTRATVQLSAGAELSPEETFGSHSTSSLWSWTTTTQRLQTNSASLRRFR